MIETASNTNKIFFSSFKRDALQLAIFSFFSHFFLTWNCRKHYLWIDPIPSNIFINERKWIISLFLKISFKYFVNQLFGNFRCCCLSNIVQNSYRKCKADGCKKYIPIDCLIHRYKCSIWINQSWFREIEMHFRQNRIVFSIFASLLNTTKTVNRFGKQSISFPVTLG